MESTQKRDFYFPFPPFLPFFSLVTQQTDKKTPVTLSQNNKYFVLIQNIPVYFMCQRLSLESNKSSNSNST